MIVVSYTGGKGALSGRVTADEPPAALACIATLLDMAADDIEVQVTEGGREPALAPDELLTEPERRALQLSADLWDVLVGVVGNGPIRDGDLGELRSAIHLVQRYVMSNAAARAYPGQYRALGETRLGLVL